MLPLSQQSLSADVDGFSLHAAVRSGADDQQALKQLCRYITRPALADKRVQTNAAGQVVRQGQDSLARRHHAPGHVPVGVHVAAGRIGTQTSAASDPFS